MRRLKIAVLFLARAAGLFTLARWLTRRNLKILCYHGFAYDDEADFRPLLFMRPALFEQRMARLRELGYRVLPLNEAVERMYDGTLPSNAVALTIDDGFESTYSLAVPILAKHRLPATVYVTSYYVAHDAPVFRLLVQYMFWKARRAPLHIQRQTWHPDACIDADDAVGRDRLQQALIAHGEAAGSEAARHALGLWLAEALGLDFQALAESRKLHMMRPEHLRKLAEFGVSVELHTHRHRFPTTDFGLAQREILDNRASLERWLPGPFEHFCYPSGEFHERQFDWLDSVGVKSSTTCLPGLNTAATPRQALHRFLDGQNIHALEFESALCGFSDLLRRKRV